MEVATILQATQVLVINKLVKVTPFDKWGETHPSEDINLFYCKIKTAVPYMTIQ